MLFCPAHSYLGTPTGWHTFDDRLFAAEGLPLVFNFDPSEQSDPPVAENPVTPLNPLSLTSQTRHPRGGVFWNTCDLKLSLTLNFPGGGPLFQFSRNFGPRFRHHHSVV